MSFSHPLGGTSMSSSRKKTLKECPFRGYKPIVFRNKRINIPPEVVVKETHSNHELINDGSISLIISTTNATHISME